MAQLSLQPGHVGLNVTDLNRSKQFYQTIFQLDVLGESATPGREFVFLGDDGKVLLTLWPQSKGRFAAQNPGLHHLSFQVETIEKVKEAEARIRKQGVKVHHTGIVPHAERLSSGGVFFEDPDGIRLEITAPQGADAEGKAPYGEAPTCGFF